MRYRVSRKSKHNRRGIAMILDAERLRRDSAASDAAPKADAWPDAWPHSRSPLPPLQVVALPNLARPSLDVAALAVPALHRLMGPNAAGNRG